MPEVCKVRRVHLWLCVFLLRTGLSTIGDAETSNQSCMHNFSAAWTEVKSLLKNPLYVVVTMGMSSLYFVVTGRSDTVRFGRQYSVSLHTVRHANGVQPGFYSQ